MSKEKVVSTPEEKKVLQWLVANAEGILEMLQKQEKENEMAQETAVFEISVIFKGTKRSVEYEIPYENEDETYSEVEERVRVMIEESQESGFVKFEDVNGDNFYLSVDNIDVIRF